MNITLIRRKNWLDIGIKRLNSSQDCGNAAASDKCDRNIRDLLCTRQRKMSIAKKLAGLHG
jgi:hypothetical protein